MTFELISFEGVADDLSTLDAAEQQFCGNCVFGGCGGGPSTSGNCTWGCGA
jgi:hypothetical protein